MCSSDLTQKNGFIDEKFLEDESKMVWKEFSQEDAACWSGVGYIFGKKLAKKLGVTVGLIGCNWGGTSASTWMGETRMWKDTDMRIYLEEYYKKNEGISAEEQKAAYEKYIEEIDIWNANVAKCYEENPAYEWSEILERCGECQWPGPINMYNPYRPAGLYETMVKRIAPYSMRGFLYYQGESDDHRPSIYAKMLRGVIEEWRALWEEDTMPFLFVQLPMHKYMKLDLKLLAFLLIHLYIMRIIFRFFPSIYNPS